VMRCLFVRSVAMQSPLGGLLLRFANRWPLNAQTASVSPLLHAAALYEYR